MRKIMSLLFLLSSGARAAVPSSFSLQGLVRDGSGALQSKMVNVTVELWDAQSGGNKLAGPFGPTAVMATDGLFTVPISDAGLTAAFASQVWLQVTIGNDTFARQPVTPQPSALVCGIADTAKSYAGDTLGIGTSTPDPDRGLQVGQAYKFNIYAESPGNSMVIDANGDVDLRQSLGTNNGSSSILFKTGMGTALGGTGATVERMRIERDGKVGIGVSNPVAPLELGDGIMQLDGRGLIAMNRYWDGAWKYRKNGYGALIDSQSDTAGGIAFYVNQAGTKDTQVTGNQIAMYIAPNGFVGVGTTTPGTNFEVNGWMRAANSSQPALQLFRNSAPTDQKLSEFSDFNGTFVGRFINDAYTQASDWIHVSRQAGSYQVGQVLFPSGNVTIAGNLTVNGSFTNPSDARLKKNVREIEHALDSLDRLRGVRFDWKKDGKPSIGVIAQEVEAVYPELVVTAPEDGMKSVDYPKLAGVLIQATKELKSKNDRLERANTELDARLRKIEARLMALR